MLVLIKRIDKKIPLPSYKTKGAVCIDLATRETVNIRSQNIAYLPLNISLKIPKGYFSLLAARSSTHKMGIMAANGIGIIDTDYCGDNDEILFAAYNFTDREVTIEKGTRVAQLMVLAVEKMDLEEVESLESPDRGGFGSTGKK